VCLVVTKQPAVVVEVSPVVTGQAPVVIKVSPIVA
jgi:hypothetical protein